MTTDFAGIEIEIAWWDDDVVELAFICSNLCFAGRTELYASHDGLHEFAELLSGFPKDPSDSRKYEFGTFSPDFAGGGVRLHFYCTDAAGHSCVDVEMITDASYAGTRRPESAMLSIPLEPAAIDRFVRQVQNVPLQKGMSARLRMAT